MSNPVNINALLLDLAAVLIRHAGGESNTTVNSGRGAVINVAPGATVVVDEATLTLPTQPEAEEIETPAAPDEEPGEAFAEEPADSVAPTKRKRRTKAEMEAARAAEAAAKAAKDNPVAEPKVLDDLGEPDAPEADELTADGYRAQLEAMNIEELRALAISMEWEPEDVAAASQEDIITAILGEKFPDDVTAAQAEDYEQEQTPEPSSESVTREDLMEMALPAMRRFAVSLGATDDELKGLDKDAIADIILSFQDGTREVIDEDDQNYTEEELRALSRADLWTLATNPVDHPEIPGLGHTDLPKDISAEDLADLVVSEVIGVAEPELEEIPF